MDLQKIADGADMIVSGIAFTHEGDRIRVLDLGRPDQAALLDMDGQVLATTMDDIEL